MVSQLEMCKPKPSETLTDEDILCNAGTQLEAVQLCDKIESSRKRSEVSMCHTRLELCNNCIKLPIFIHIHGYETHSSECMAALVKRLLLEEEVTVKFKSAFLQQQSQSASCLRWN